MAAEGKDDAVPTTLTVHTASGDIKLTLRADAAPETVTYIAACVRAKVYDADDGKGSPEPCTFYRSDFVIQTGLHGTGRTHAFGDLKVNETGTGVRIGNTRGTAAIAHWDVPDCGNTEWFINLKANDHLDEAYGGYCVFAQVEAGDDASFAVVDKIAAEVKAGTHTKILSMTIA